MNDPQDIIVRVLVRECIANLQFLEDTCDASPDAYARRTQDILTKAAKETSCAVQAQQEMEIRTNGNTSMINALHRAETKIKQCFDCSFSSDLNSEKVKSVRKYLIALLQRFSSSDSTSEERASSFAFGIHSELQTVKHYQDMHQEVAALRDKVTEARDRHRRSLEITSAEGGKLRSAIDRKTRELNDSALMNQEDVAGITEAHREEINALSGGLALTTHGMWNELRTLRDRCEGLAFEQEAVEREHLSDQQVQAARLRVLKDEVVQLSDLAKLLRTREATVRDELRSAQKEMETMCNRYNVIKDEADRQYRRKENETESGVGISNKLIEFLGMGKQAQSETTKSKKRV